MQTKGFLYSLAKVDNSGNICHGAPFLALDVDTAKRMVKEVFDEHKDCVNPDDYRLVQLCGYDLAAEKPITIPFAHKEFDLDFLKGEKDEQE